MTGPHPLKELTFPAAKELSETLLFQRDIESAIIAMKIWSGKTRENAKLSPEDHVVCQAIFRDAVVQFVGCFDKGAKFALVRDDIYQSEHMVYFQWLVDLRDSYAAHKFGAWRQCAMGAFVDTKGSIVGLGHHMAVYTGPSPQGGPQFVAFMQIAGDFVASELERLRIEVERQVSLLSPSEIASLQNAIFYGVDHSEVSTSRAELQRKRTGKPSTARRRR